MSVQPASVARVRTTGSSSAQRAEAVTVAISLHNYAHRVVECLDSLVAQTYPWLELVVVDDASTDSSLDVVSIWLDAHHERFLHGQLVSHPENRGLSAARNTGFSLSRTDPVMVLDSDNMLHPRCIERLAEHVLSGEYSAAYSQIELFEGATGLADVDVWSRERLRRGNTIDAMAMLSRSAWERAGGYHHLEGGYEDYDLWCTFAERGFPVLFVPEVLCRYRVHSDSMLRSVTPHHLQELQRQLTARHPWLTLD